MVINIKHHHIPVLTVIDLCELRLVIVHGPLSTTINHFQPLTNMINHYLPLLCPWSMIINHYQPSLTKIHWRIAIASPQQFPTVAITIPVAG